MPGWLPPGREMEKMITKIRIPALALLAMALGAAAASARAAEQVTLANGFIEQCDHHAQVHGHVRLYLSSGQDNYIDFTPQQVVSVETVPDPPPAPSVSQPSKSTTPLSKTDLHEILDRAGQQHNLDVDLLASVVKAESAGNPHAVSRVGAQGLMQLMPGTAASLGVNNSFAPDQNVQGGSTYLDALLTRYHNNLALALAAYNAGPHAVDRYHGIPPYRETRAYVARVIHAFNRRVLARQAQARLAAVTTRVAIR